MKNIDYYHSCYARLYFLYHGNFENFHKSTYFDYFKEIADKEIVPLQEILYRALGYESDSNLSSTKRFLLRKEIAENLDKSEFWTSKYPELGVSRTSQVVDYYDSLNVLGIGKEFASSKLNNRSYKGFELFLKNEKEMVDVFCGAAPFLVTNITSKGKALTMDELSEYFDLSSKQSYDNSKINLGVSPKDMFILNFINKESIYIENNIMYVPKSKLNTYSAEFIQDSLVYAYFIRANKIPVMYLNTYESVVKHLGNIFTLSQDFFKYIIDVSNMTGLSTKEIYRLEGLELIDPEEMIKLSHGLFITLDNCVDYVPEIVKTKSKMEVPCRLPDKTFLDIINKRLYKDITYKRGIPYYGNQCLFVGSV